MGQHEIRRAIIFAAGSGSRLGSYTRDIPKTLLKVGDQTIFDKMVSTLSGIGIGNVIVVIGFAGEKLRSHVSTLSRSLIGNPIAFEFIENTKLELGNVYSFWLAREYMNEDFLLLNSDVIFDQRILELLVRSPHSSALAIDDHKELAEEEMKVLTSKNGVIKEISKKIDPQLAKGEYIGVMKISAPDAQIVLGKIADMLKEQDSPSYYEDAIRIVAKETDTFFSCSTQGLSWTEIDTPEDLSYARDIVLRDLQRADGIEVRDRSGSEAL